MKTMPEREPFKVPGFHEIRTKNLDYLTGRATEVIWKVTGLDPWSVASEGRYGMLQSVLGWWEAHRMPQYHGITWEEVLSWPVSVFDLYDPDADAQDVREAVEDLGDPAPGGGIDGSGQPIGAGDPEIPFGSPSETGYDSRPPGVQPPM